MHCFLSYLTQKSPGITLLKKNKRFVKRIIRFHKIAVLTLSVRVPYVVQRIGHTSCSCKMNEEPMKLIFFSYDNNFTTTFLVLSTIG